MPWYADPIWGFIANVATILSLIAIGVAIYELVSRVQWVRPVAWGTDVIGDATLPDGSQHHVVEVYNAGTGSARIIMAYAYNATVRLEDEYRLPSVVGAGVVRRLLVSAERIDEAWLMLGWIGQTEARRVRFEWLPITRNGIAGHEWEQARARTPVPKWWRRPFQGRRPTMVGPGGRIEAFLRAGHTSHEDITAMLPPGQIAFPAAAQNGYVRDLPVSTARGHRPR